MAGGEVSTRIDSVNRTERLGPHEHIRNIGGIRAAGVVLQAEPGRWDRGHRSRKVDLYVERPAGHVVNVVIESRLGRRYLKTETNDEHPNNLLSLPECPT